MLGTNGRRRVLIVDPDPAHCATLGRALAERNYEVHVSHCGNSALAAAEGGAIGHAVVELQLPDHSGLKLVQQLRASNGKVNIVVLASNPSIATAVEAIKLGATHYLPKPARPEEVIDAFEQGNDSADASTEPRMLSLDALIWEHIDRALAATGGNVSAAARALDLHRRTLQRKLQQRARRTACKALERTRSRNEATDLVEAH